MAIDYTKKTWNNLDAPAMSATNIQYMDDAIQAACDALDAMETLINLAPIAAPPYTEGNLYYNSDTHTLDFTNDIEDVTLNIGEELWIRFVNKTGVTIVDGSAVYINGVSGNLPTVALSDASGASTAAVSGIVTHDVPNNQQGIITVFGILRNLDTSAWSEGTVLYLSATTPGAFTSSSPVAPNYSISLGVVLLQHATQGKIGVRAPSTIHNRDFVIYGLTVNNDLNVSGQITGSLNPLSTFFNGAIVETIDIDVTSDGSTITFSLQQDGEGDLTLLLDEELYTLDTTPAATVELTAGSDESPQLNYVYIPDSTKTLTASTTGFPSEEYAPVATVLCQSALSLQTDGAIKVHAWTDHLESSNYQGHLSHINYWIRHQPATWATGVVLTPTVGASQFDIATTSGTVLQLHPHDFPALDTGTGSEIYVANHPDAAYSKVSSLTIADGVDKDANGDALGNAGSDFYNLVIWGVVSEKAADCKLFVNVPNGYYANDSGGQAQDDLDNTAIYDIPDVFTGTGFLIARLTVQISGSTYSIIKQTDLRGILPGVAGGTIPGGNEFFDNVFRIKDESDDTKQLAFEVSGVATGTTRTLTVPDGDGTIALDLTTFHTNVPLEFSAFKVEYKPDPAPNDLLLIEDCKDDYVKKGTTLTKLKWVSIPATSTSTGEAGQSAYDSDYLYICIATNTWKRVALNTW